MLSHRCRHGSTKLGYEAELQRLRGERLVKFERGVSDERAAEACFKKSVAVAREQDALSVELRSAMSLARLHLHRRSRVRPRDIILPVYERFTEGFDTPDLRDARALLNHH